MDKDGVYEPSYTMYMMAHLRQPVLNGANWGANTSTVVRGYAKGNIWRGSTNNELTYCLLVSLLRHLPNQPLQQRVTSEIARLLLYSILHVVLLFVWVRKPVRHGSKT